MATTMPKAGEVDRKWYVLDAAGKPLGRVAAKAAHLLRGKHKPTFAPHVDCGDNVIIINCAKAVLTGKKGEQKFYPHPLRLSRRPQGDQVPHPDAGEARAGHEGGHPRHDAPNVVTKDLPDPASHLSAAAEHNQAAQKPEAWTAE